MNNTRKTVLCSKASVADNFFTRARGLLGRRNLAEGEGLVITRCRSIHMFFMRFPIDAVFIDSQGAVVGFVENILPYQLSPVFWSADRVVELPAGTIKATATDIGDYLQTAI